MSKDKKKPVHFGGEVLNLKQAAELLNCNTRTLIKYISTKRVHGKIFARKFDRLWLIQKKEIYKFLDGENGRKD